MVRVEMYDPEWWSRLTLAQWRARVHEVRARTSGLHLHDRPSREKLLSAAHRGKELRRERKGR